MGTSKNLSKAQCGKPKHFFMQNIKVQFDLFSISAEVQLPQQCLTFSIKRDSVKPPPCVVDRSAGGSLTRRPKGPFAVSWPRQFGE